MAKMRIVEQNPIAAIADTKGLSHPTKLLAAGQIARNHFYFQNEGVRPPHCGFYAAQCRVNWQP